MCKLETRLLTLFFTMDLNNINQEEIIQKITDEVLKELQESNENFTNEEIKNKINEKIDNLLSQIKDEQIEKEKIQGEKEDEFLREEFTDINVSQTNANDSFSRLQNSVRNTKAPIQTQQEEDETETEQEPEEKKQFFKEFSDLYKQELQNSIDSFRKTFESFSLMKQSSFIEKFLILLLLSIPAVLAGLVGFLLIGILFVLWQIYLFIQIFTKSFDKIEASIKESMSKMKIKISSMKNGTGFLNRIIFSNILYSVLMFNGMLYVIVKGLAFPIRSLGEIDKILANIAARSMNLVSTALRSPSELALNNLRTSNAMGRDKSKASSGPVKSRQVLRLNERLLASNRARDALASKLRQIQNISKRERDSIKPKVVLNTNEIRKGIFDKVQKNVIESQVKNLVDSKAAQMQQQSMQHPNNTASNSNTNSITDRKRGQKDERNIDPRDRSRTKNSEGDILGQMIAKNIVGSIAQNVLNNVNRGDIKIKNDRVQNYNERLDGGNYGSNTIKQLINYREDIDKINYCKNMHGQIKEINNLANIINGENGNLIDYLEKASGIDDIKAHYNELDDNGKEALIEKVNKDLDNILSKLNEEENKLEQNKQEFRSYLQEGIEPDRANYIVQRNDLKEVGIDFCNNISDKANIVLSEKAIEDFNNKFINIAEYSKDSNCEGKIKEMMTDFIKDSFGLDGKDAKTFMENDADIISIVKDAAKEVKEFRNARQQVAENNKEVGLVK